MGKNILREEIWKSFNVRRGELYVAKLEGKGNQQKGKRAVVIYSNNGNNKKAPTLNVIPLTSKNKELCVHVLLEGHGLKCPSMALLEQITTINKNQLVKRIGQVSKYDMQRIDAAADIQFGRAPVRRYTIKKIKKKNIRIAA